MIELVKNWLNMIIILGIAFTLIRMIIPNTNLKKYTNSMIGVVIIITLLTPIISLISKKNITEQISEPIKDILSVETMSKNYDDYTEVNTNNVKREFEHRLEEDIKNKLKNKINQEVQVNVKVDNTYNIEIIEIWLSKNTYENIKNIISNDYDVLEEKIVVYKGV